MEEAERAFRSTLARVDHIIYAAPDLDAGVERLLAMVGVRAAPGGRHPAWGTHNALIGLGEHVYLEILAPDPEAAAPAGPRLFGLDRSRLVTWAVAATDLERVVSAATGQGVDLGEVLHRERRRPDGTILRWTMTDPTMPRLDGLVPFFIDWGDTPHPAASAPTGARLIGLRARHPDAERVRATLHGLGLALEVARADEPELIVTLETPRGVVELR